VVALAGGEVVGQCVEGASDRIAAALFQRAEDGHQDGLAVGPALAAVALAVFADDHRRADCPFGAVVLEGNIRLVQAREQVVLMAPQALDQACLARVFAPRIDQFLQAGASRARREAHCSVKVSSRVCIWIVVESTVG